MSEVAEAQDYGAMTSVCGKCVPAPLLPPRILLACPNAGSDYSRGWQPFTPTSKLCSMSRTHPYVTLDELMFPRI